MNDNEGGAGARRARRRRSCALIAYRSLAGRTLALMCTLPRQGRTVPDLHDPTRVGAGRDLASELLLPDGSEYVRPYCFPPGIIPKG